MCCPKTSLPPASRNFSCHELDSRFLGVRALLRGQPNVLKVSIFASAETTPRRVYSR